MLTTLFAQGVGRFAEIERPQKHSDTVSVVHSTNREEKDRLLVLRICRRGRPKSLIKKVEIRSAIRDGSQPVEIVSRGNLANTQCRVSAP